MSTIFASVPGRAVLALEAEGPESFTLSVGGQNDNEGGFESTGFTTSFDMQQKVAAQFQITLDRSLFAIPFGDDIGRLSIGLVHGLVCDGRGGDTLVDTGRRIQDWYRRNKFQASKLEPIRVTVGETNYAGYLLAMSLNAQAAEGSMLRSQLELVAWGLP